MKGPSSSRRPRAGREAAISAATVIRLNDPSKPPLAPRQPADDDLGMRWAVAWYEGTQSYRRRMGHVAA